MEMAIPAGVYPAQFMYPTSYLTAASATSPGVLATMPTTSPLSPTAATAGTPTQYALDYASAYSAATAAQYAASGYEAYSPYNTTGTTAAAAAYGVGLPAGYTYAMPQQLAGNATHFAQFQPQQIQERLQ